LVAIYTKQKTNPIVLALSVLPMLSSELHGVHINQRPSLHKRVEKSLLSVSYHQRSENVRDSQGWYTLVYGEWVEALSKRDIIANNLDPYRYIYPWFEYKTYDLMEEVRGVGYSLDWWEWDQKIDGYYHLVLTAKAQTLENWLHEFEDFFRTVRKIAVLKGRPAPAELDSYLEFYENAVEDARTLLFMSSRRMQQHLTELSIEESQRSIREAISVKRLTQLAFVFIPLTFATSIFGMNLDILTGNGARFWVFMVTTICVLMIVFVFWQTSRIFENWWKLHKNKPTSFYWFHTRKLRFVYMCLTHGHVRMLSRWRVLIALFTRGRVGDDSEMRKLDEELCQKELGSGAA